MPQHSQSSHSLRSIVIAAPTVLIPFSFVLHVLHRVTGDDDYAQASYISMVGGVAGGLAATVIGAVESTGKEEDSQLKHDNQMRAAFSGASMLAHTANLILRRKGLHDHGGSVLLSAVATAGTLVARWYDDRMQEQKEEQKAGDGRQADAGKISGVDNAGQDVRIDHRAPDVEQYVAAGPATDTHPAQR